MKLFWILFIIPVAAFSPQQGPSRFGKAKNAKHQQASEHPSRRSYANLADPPPTTETQPSFESRMRKLVLSRPPSSSTSSSSVNPTTTTHPAVHRVTSLRDYKHLLNRAQDKLTVVRFYADYCRSCRAMTPAFYRLANASRQDQVQWAEVPVTPETSKIHQGLQVPSVPYGHIYHPIAGLVEELRLRKEFLASFAQILKSYQDGECALPDEPNPESGIFEATYERHS